MRFSLRDQGFRSAVKPPPAPDHSFGPDALSFRCGMRVGWLKAGWPAARVTFDGDWLTMKGLLVGQVWIERALVTGTRPISYAWVNGIQFETVDGRYDGVILWLRGMLAEHLHSAGWPVLD